MGKTKKPTVPDKARCLHLAEQLATELSWIFRKCDLDDKVTEDCRWGDSALQTATDIADYLKKAGFKE